MSCSDVNYRYLVGVEVHADEKVQTVVPVKRVMEGGNVVKNYITT